MRKYYVGLVYAAVAMIIVGCQTMPYQPYARQVKVKPKKGGVIALKLSYRQEDRQKADQMMATTCGSKTAEVQEEGEVVVGTKTTTDKDNYNYNRPKSGTFFSFGSSDSSSRSRSETTEKKEWRIKYKCS